MTTLPVKALSIRQPWAWLIVNGLKDIENRSWSTSFRGPVLIHTGVKEDEDFDSRDFDGVLPADGEYPWQGDAVAQCGGIVGIADIVDCVSEHASPWFFGRFGFVLANARPLPFIPVKGALGFFDWQSRIITPSAKAPPLPETQPETAPAQGRLF